MPITFRSVLEHGLQPAASLLTEGFSDYFVPVQMSVAGLLSMVRQDSVDLQSSRVLLRDGQPLGVALIARRGWTSRLAAMSIIPPARGQGIGVEFVGHLLDNARARGDRSMTLEVIEQNAPAVRLYQKCSFQIQRRLVSYIGQPPPQPARADLLETDLREVARVLIAYGPPDLPWQLSGETLAHATPPNVAYRTSASYIALSNPDAPTVTIRALVTLPEARRQKSATELLRAVITRHPQKTWRVPAILPEEFGGLLERVGLQRDTLTQWQMNAPLEQTK